jgi:hypothetical protein
MELSGTTGLTLHLSDHASGNHIYTSSSEHISPDRARAQRPVQPRRRHPQAAVSHAFIVLNGHRSGSIQVAGSNSGCVASSLVAEGSARGSRRTLRSCGISQLQIRRPCPLSSFTLENSEHNSALYSSVDLI